MNKTIAWVLYRLDTIGGGERLLLEGARHYRSLGYRVIIITWSFNEAALFGGLYENLDIFELGVRDVPRDKVLKVAWERSKSLLTLRRLLKSNNVSTVFCQGEYDVALVYLATLWTKVRYRFLVFGQMFQYPHDQGKYALIFRKHLKEIVSSCAGYRDTIPLMPKPLGILHRLANEVISVVRFLAVRRAEKTFSFSRQVQWETKKLFDVRPVLAKGAYRAEICEQENFSIPPYESYGIPAANYILSVSRLDRKKRIDVIVRAFARMSSTDFHLVIGGTGDNEQCIRDEIRKCGVEDRVHLIGRVDEEDLLPLKHYCSLFVSMDIGDFDISPLEALAVGAPVVCPEEFELDESMQKVVALRTCEATDEALAATMQDVLSSGARAQRNDLKAYSWEYYFDRLIE